MNHCNCPTENTAAKATAEAVKPRFKTTEDENGIVLRIALPGVTRENLKLTLLESHLKVEASRNEPTPDDWKTHRSNSLPQAYSLNLRLGSRFDGSKGKATLESGLLTLEIPLREEAKPREIAVN